MIRLATGYRSSSGRCAPSRHPADDHPQVLIIARDGTIGFSVWIDEEHIRQARIAQSFLDESDTMTKTVELWDFGVLARAPD
jgi:hypothetical protein